MSDWPALQTISVVVAVIGVLFSLASLILVRRKVSRNEERTPVAEGALSSKRQPLATYRHVTAGNIRSIQVGRSATQRNPFKDEKPASRDPGAEAREAGDTKPDSN